MSKLKTFQELLEKSTEAFDKIDDKDKLKGFNNLIDLFKKKWFD